MESFVAETEVNGMVLFSCLECGTLVTAGSRNLHSDWHHEHSL